MASDSRLTLMPSATPYIKLNALGITTIGARLNLFFFFELRTAKRPVAVLVPYVTLYATSVLVLNSLRPFLGMAQPGNTYTFFFSLLVSKPPLPPPGRQPRQRPHMQASQNSSRRKIRKRPRKNEKPRRTSSQIRKVQTSLKGKDPCKAQEAHRRRKRRRRR